MKQVVFIVLLLVTFSKQWSMKDASPALFEKIESFTDDCIQESNANEDDVVKILDKSEFTDSKELKCYLKCVLIKANLMNTKGDIVEGSIRTQMPTNLDKSKVNAIIGKCKLAKADDACETGFGLMKCLLSS